MVTTADFARAVGLAVSASPAEVLSRIRDYAAWLNALEGLTETRTPRDALVVVVRWRQEAALARMLDERVTVLERGIETFGWMAATNQRMAEA